LGHQRIRFNYGLRVDTSVNGLRLTGIEFDARTLCVIAEAIGAGEGCGDAVAADVGAGGAVDFCRPRDPAYARYARFGGFKSAEARSAKAEDGDPYSLIY
jgi:hypothetical protein